MIDTEHDTLASFDHDEYAGIFAQIATKIGLETWAYTGGLPEAGYGWGWSWIYAVLVGIWGVGVVEVSSSRRTNPSL